MKDAQALQADIFVNLRRQTFSARFFILMLIVAFYMVSVKATASTQNCWNLCQQGLAACLLAAEGDPVQGARCQDNYDKCAADCM